MNSKLNKTIMKANLCGIMMAKYPTDAINELCDMVVDLKFTNKELLLRNFELIIDLCEHDAGLREDLRPQFEKIDSLLRKMEK